MKKLLLGLLAFSVNHLWADSITSGSVGLLKVSVGVVGTRNWGDKYNENFQIIANTMTGIINGTIPISGSGGGSGVNQVTIYDEGSPQGNINTLNVVGGAVSIVVVGTTGTLTVTANGSGLPLAAGDTGYMSTYATQTVTQSPTFISSVTFNGVVQGSSISAFMFYTTAPAAAFKGESSSFTNVSIANILAIDNPPGSVIMGVSSAFGGSLTLNNGKIILMPTGSINAPSIAYGADQSAGLVFLGAAPTRVALTALNKDRIRYDSNGHVTIGGLGQLSHSLFVGTASLTNQPIFAVSSATTKFEITGTTGSTNVDMFFSSDVYLTKLISQGTLGTDGSGKIIPGTGGGGGGGGGSMAIYNGVTSLSLSTISFPGASIQSGAGASTVTYNLMRIADVIIGTAGALGADYKNNNFTTSMNQAMSDKGASITSTNTVPLNVFVLPGVYNGSRSTVPANVYLWTVPNPSGTILALDNDSATIVTNWGTMSGFTLDAGASAFTSSMLLARSNSRADHLTFIGAQNMANYNTGASLVSTRGSSNVVISDSWFKEYHGCAGQTSQGTCGAFLNDGSTDTIAYRILFSSPAYFGSLYETIWSGMHCTRCVLKDSVFDGVNGIAVSIGSGRDYEISGNTFKSGAGTQGDGANYGLITIDGSDETISAGPSTGAVISNNTFVFKSTGGAPGNIIRARSYSAGIGNGYLISGNRVVSPNRTNYTFFTEVGGTVFNIVLKNNDVYNLETFLKDAGIGTKYVDMGNVFNGVPLNSDYTSILSTRTTVFYDEGTVLAGGHANVINCVGPGVACTQTNSTVTLTVTVNPAPSIQNPATGYFNMNNSGISNSTGMGVGRIVAEGSSTLKGIIISTTGFQVGGSTVQGVFLLEGGSWQFRNGTNEFTLTFATIPSAGQKIGVLDVTGTRVLLGGTGDNAGSGSGTSGSDGFGNPVSTRPITATSGADVSSLTVIGVTTFMGDVTSTGAITASTFTATSSMTAYDVTITSGFRLPVGDNLSLKTTGQIGLDTFSDSFKAYLGGIGGMAKMPMVIFDSSPINDVRVATTDSTTESAWTTQFRFPPNFWKVGRIVVGWIGMRFTSTATIPTFTPKMRMQKGGATNVYLFTGIGSAPVAATNTTNGMFFSISCLATGANGVLLFTNNAGGLGGLSRSQTNGWQTVDLTVDQVMQWTNTYGASSNLNFNEINHMTLIAIN